jgi:hypothetical protein
VAKVRPMSTAKKIAAAHTAAEDAAPAAADQVALATSTPQESPPPPNPPSKEEVEAAIRTLHRMAEMAPVEEEAEGDDLVFRYDLHIQAGGLPPYKLHNRISLKDVFNVENLPDMPSLLESQIDLMVRPLKNYLTRAMNDRSALLQSGGGITSMIPEK